MLYLRSFGYMCKPLSGCMVTNKAYTTCIKYKTRYELNQLHIS